MAVAGPEDPVARGVPEHVRWRRSMSPFRTHMQRPRQRGVDGPAVLAHCGACIALLATAAAAAADVAPVAPADSPEEVQVTARRLHVETRVDRKVYTQDADEQALSGSLADLLNAIPSVDVDSEGVVSLRGDTNVVILVDGKPSAQLSGPNAAANMLSLPARNIRSIEILATPPAEFAASGAAGIINIVTRAKSAEPASGSARASVGSGGRAAAGASVAWHVDAWALSANAAYRRELRERTIVSRQRAPDAGSGQWLDTTSALAETIWRTVPSADVTASHDAGGHDTFELTLAVTGHGDHRRYAQANRTTTPADATLAASTRDRSRHDAGTDLDGSSTFTHVFRSPDETLKVSLARFASNPHASYVETTYAQLPVSAPLRNDVRIGNAYGTTGLDVDYALPLSKKRSLKAGLSWERDTWDNDTDGVDIDLASGAQAQDPFLTHAFRYRQAIGAAYLDYQLEDRDGKWTWLAGLRAESARTRIDDVTDAYAASNTQGGLFPDVHVLHVLSKDATLSLGASRRITRPEPENLNPFVYREYSPNVRAGNPLLGPQLTQSWELAYQLDRKGRSLGVTAYYRDNRGSVADVTTATADGLSLTTPRNLGRDTSFGLEIVADGTLARSLNYDLSANLAHDQLPTATPGVAGTRSATRLDGKAKLTWRRIAGESLQLTITRKGRVLATQGQVDATTVVSAGFQHALADGLAAVARVWDLLDGQRYRRTLATATFAQEYVRTTQGRVFYLGVVYSFGSTKSAPRPEDERAE